MERIEAFASQALNGLITSGEEISQVTVEAAWFLADLMEKEALRHQPTPSAPKPTPSAKKVAPPPPPPPVQPDLSENGRPILKLAF